MDAKRKRQIADIGKLRDAFTGEHPGISVAMDVAADALLRVMQEGDEKITPMFVTKTMFKAVMEAGFMVMHRDEIQNALLACARAGQILDLTETK